MPDYSQRVSAPSPDSINTNCKAVKPSTMKTVLGDLVGPLSTDCQNSKASEKVKQLLETRDVGHSCNSLKSTDLLVVWTDKNVFSD